MNYKVGKAVVGIIRPAIVHVLITADTQLFVERGSGIAYVSAEDSTRKGFSKSLCREGREHWTSTVRIDIESFVEDACRCRVDYYIVKTGRTGCASWDYAGSMSCDVADCHHSSICFD